MMAQNNGFNAGMSEYSKFALNVDSAHKRTQCPISQEEIEYMIQRQRMRLEQNFHVQFDFDVCERPQTWGALKKENWALFRAHLFLSK